MLHSSPRRLKMFIAVFEERSFTAAAARENATQSGISQHIQKLEEELGVRLFERKPNSVEPTPAGTVYYNDCLRFLQAYEQANARIVATFGKGLAGEVAVGVTPTMARSAIAPTLSTYLATNPNVIVRITDAYSNIVIEKVRASEVDFALIPASDVQSGVKSTRFATTQEMLVTSRHTGRRHLQPLRLADLGPLKIVLPSTAQARRDDVENYLIASGAHIEQRLEIDSMFATLDFLALNDWVAILPAIMLLPEIRSHQFLVHPLQDPGLTLDIFQVQLTRVSLSPAAQQFLNVMHQETETLHQQIGQILHHAPASGIGSA